MLVCSERIEEREREREGGEREREREREQSIDKRGRRKGEGINRGEGHEQRISIMRRACSRACIRAHG